MPFGNNFKTIGDADKEKEELRKEAVRETEEIAVKKKLEEESQKRTKANTGKGQLDAIKRQIALKQSAIRSEQNSLSFLKAEIGRSASAAIGAKNSEIKRLSLKLGEAKNEIEALSRKLSEKTKEMIKFDAEIKNLASLEKKEKEEERKIGTKRIVAGQRERIIGNLNADLKELESEKSRLESQLASLK